MTLRSFFTQHNCRTQELIDERLQKIPQAIPAIRDAAVIQSAVGLTKILDRLGNHLRKGEP